MTGDPNAIDALLAATRLHWTAIEAYTLAASLCRVTFDLSKLADYFGGEADDERVHLGRLIDRLRALDVDPTAEHESISIPGGPVELISASLSLETDARDTERAGVLACRDAGDEISAGVLAENLEGTEDSIRHLEAERRQIVLMGVQNWIASQQ